MEWLKINEPEMKRQLNVLSDLHCIILIMLS